MHSAYACNIALIIKRLTGSEINCSEERNQAFFNSISLTLTTLFSTNKYIPLTRGRNICHPVS